MHALPNRLHRGPFLGEVGVSILTPGTRTLRDAALEHTLLLLLTLQRFLLRLCVSVCVCVCVCVCVLYMCRCCPVALFVALGLDDDGLAEGRADVMVQGVLRRVRPHTDHKRLGGG